MKRLYILFITAILLCTALSAQEADIRKVAERYKGINTFTTTVIRTKHHAAVAEDAVTKGKFHFMQPNEAYMTFNEGKDMLIMDNGVFTMINDGQESIAKGVTHKQFEVLLIVLKNLLSSDSDSTDIKEVADMEITKQGNLCALTITPIIPDAKAKRRMMFTSFVLTSVRTATSKNNAKRIRTIDRHRFPHDTIKSLHTAVQMPGMSVWRFIARKLIPNRINHKIPAGNTVSITS